MSFHLVHTSTAPISRGDGIRQFVNFDQALDAAQEEADRLIQDGYEKAYEQIDIEGEYAIISLTLRMFVAAHLIEVISNG